MLRNMFIGSVAHGNGGVYLMQYKSSLDQRAFFFLGDVANATLP
jgi:hypothetical protein